MTTAEIIGVYPIEADEPLHLIEIRFKDLPGKFDLGSITQEWPGKERSQWQVPYLEQILNSAGDSLLANWMQIDKKPELWNGDVRMVFFFHYLSFERPLQAPFGDVPVPEQQNLPPRLSMVSYFPP